MALPTLEWANVHGWMKCALAATWALRLAGWTQCSRQLMPQRRATERYEKTWWNRGTSRQRQSRWAREWRRTSGARGMTSKKGISSSTGLWTTWRTTGWRHQSQHRSWIYWFSAKNRKSGNSRESSSVKWGVGWGMASRTHGTNRHSNVALCGLVCNGLDKMGGPVWDMCKLASVDPNTREGVW